MSKYRYRGISVRKPSMTSCASSGEKIRSSSAFLLSLINYVLEMARIESGKYDVVILNFANCDMVGHNGVFDAANAAVEAVDTCVGAVVKAVTDHGGVALITADHGNADKMYEADGTKFN